MTSMFIILAAMLACLKAENAAETTCLMGSMVANCSDFQAFRTVKDFDPSANDEVLNLLQTQAVLSKPSNTARRERHRAWHTRSPHTSVYIGKPTMKHNGNKNRGSLERPLWQKTLRCSGPTMDDCEECVGNNNCWGDCKPPGRRRGIDRCVHVNSQKWTRFVVLIHIRCDLRMTVRVRPAEITGGVMKFYWDEQPKKTFTRKIKWPRFWQTVVKTKHKGGNAFMVEFVPKSKMAIGKFNDLLFKLGVDYATCLDTKSCLHTLKDEADLPLRTSSALMHQCLKTGMDMVLVKSVANSCTKWKACLNRTDPSGEYQDRLLTMLEASGAATPTTAQVSLKQGLVPQGAATCIYPPQEDPLSWNCDCYEQMLQRCKAIGALEEVALCIRSQFCAFPDTCQHWKDMACNQQPVADMRDRLRAALPQTGSSTSPFSTLTSRASQQDMKATLAPDLDHTTGHKACA
eukprot:gnl/TRDRNA2_/TRDRNA2_176392_c0_seq70.p1 gnl/TRDRNA2_/TRDRNA2_176392_c0~~gnl/TRDRNA2_/TRDRNA2_176392_c0_seq70.p1  ORF type:complete len:460 (-),score=47.73 gnl/TRDRNA2_/TRDRNA2_176392_c0_seq70:48-1427(-)